MKFCSHFLEAAFMPAMVYYIVLGAKENRLRDWLAAGIFSALAVLGKYSAVVVLPGCLIYILMDRERRKCFLKPGIWLGMGVGLILLLPHLVWLVQHDFCCLRHVGRRISDDKMPWRPARSSGSDIACMTPFQFFVRAEPLSGYRFAGRFFWYTRNNIRICAIFPDWIWR